jgi:hypothetical protein
MILFKTPEIEKQYQELPVHNRRLKNAILMLDLFVSLELKKDIELTSLLRTPEENAAVGGIPNSPHLVWNAVDLRSTLYTDAEVNRIVAFMNSLTYHAGKSTAMAHAVGGGAYHLHIQVLP